jgi:hypothetical protein
MRILKFGLVWSILVLSACGHKAADSNGHTQKLEPDEFLAMFHDLNLPVNFADSSLQRRFPDSPMAWTAFNQFIPDSLIHKNFGKSVKPRLFASGKIQVKNAETYLFLKALTPIKKIIYLICLDKDGQFRTGMPIVLREDDSEFHYTATIDNKYAISVSRMHKDGDGKSVFVRTVWIYNAEGVFTLIMRESNEGKPRIGQIYNPIDTLSHKHKFTGDYLQDKRNFISFRDGKNNGVIRFFVHFEKDNGKCKGELKGEARFVSSGIARYIATGDPCSLEFSFNDKNVRMRELDGCGNHRDIRCFFEGVFTKHKEQNSKPAKSKHHA